MNTWLLVFTLMNQPAGCQIIDGERIWGADLARALPAFSAIPRDTILGYSPAPGLRRVFQFPELQRLAKPYHLAVPDGTHVCFEHKMQLIDQEMVRAAMRQSLHATDPRIDILAMSGGLAPEGRLFFPASGLSAVAGIEPSTPLMWRGYVLYDNSRKFGVWARVRIAATMTRVVARQALAAGQSVQERQVRLETYDGFPLRNDVARSLDEVVDRVPRRSIREGFPILLADLDQPLQVKRGDVVRVTAIAGAAMLELDAVAQASGHQGEVIPLKNPGSGKIFRARIEGRNKAIVIPGAGSLLARVQ